jgi:S-DNA-T family DNA segregation ATPase FtsK/SpoIIIE
LLLEIGSSIVAGGFVIFTHLKQNGSPSNDAQKIQTIFANSGLNIRDAGKTSTFQLLRKTRQPWGVEYCYRYPLGGDFQKVLERKSTIETGLNANHSISDFTLSDLKQLKLNRNIIRQIKDILNKSHRARKEVELIDDGTLKIRVYNEPMPEKLPYTDNMQGKGWKVPVGQSRSKNEMVYHDFEAIPHMSMGGATRYGKSQFLHMMINTLIANKPDHVRFTLVDLKGGVEFSDYENIKQVSSMATEPEEVSASLKTVFDEMKEKQIKQRKKGFKNVQQAKDPIRHFVIIDEVGELNPDEAVTKEEKALRQQCQTYMSQIARLGAGLGYRLILATQYGTGDIIPRQCKQNSDAKICFRVRNGTASRVVLDEAGAEDLPMIKGRAIYQLADQKKIVQTPLMEEEFIKENIRPHIEMKARAEDERTERKKSGDDPIVTEETGLS